MTTYQRKKEAEERRIREEGAAIERAAAEAAQKAADEAAAKMKEDADLKDAVEAEAKAKAAAALAAKAKKKAEAIAADLSRTRSEKGSVMSLRTTWLHDGLDRATVDLEALRQHIPEKGLDQAMRSFIAAGGREIKGARIYEHTETVGK